MRSELARYVMALAVRSLGTQRSDWAAAMEAEFETAAEADEPLRFALGCLVSAWRDLPFEEEGRFVIASHVLVLGVVLPVGILLLTSVTRGFPFLALDRFNAIGLLGRGAPSFFISAGNATGLPLMALLTVALGVGHARMAWLVLERDWVGVATLASLGAALLITMVTFSSIFFLFDASALPQAAVIAIELGAIWLLPRWHNEVSAAHFAPSQIYSP